MAEKKQRTCIACRTTRNQDEMLRISKQQDKIEIGSKSMGRGAYICKKSDCINLTIKKHLLNRAFKCNLNSDVYERLGEYEQNN